MPIRTASLNSQLRKNGAKLHRAIVSRITFEGEDHPASEREQALMEERRFLKEARARRHEEALQPRPKASALPHREAKPPKEPKAARPKAAKESKDTKDAKPAGKDHKPSRAEKMAKKAENLQAAKDAAKKASAKKPAKA
jgi:hypothetical protein